MKRNEWEEEQEQMKNDGLSYEYRLSLLPPSLQKGKHVAVDSMIIGRQQATQEIYNVFCKHCIYECDECPVMKFADIDVKCADNLSQLLDLVAWENK